MDGAARTARVPKTAQAAPKPSTARAPKAAATGPAAMNASGPNANAPTMLNEPTRDSTSAGSRCCVTVVAIAPPKAEPAPASSAPAATAASGRCRARASGGSGKPRVVSVLTSSGRRGRRPSASRPPMIAPPP